MSEYVAKLRATMVGVDIVSVSMNQIFSFWMSYKKLLYDHKNRNTATRMMAYVRSVYDIATQPLLQLRELTTEPCSRRIPYST